MLLRNYDEQNVIEMFFFYLFHTNYHEATHIKLKKKKKSLHGLYSSSSSSLLFFYLSSVLSSVNKSFLNKNTFHIRQQINSHFYAFKKHLI